MNFFETSKTLLKKMIYYYCEILLNDRWWSYQIMFINVCTCKDIEKKRKRSQDIRSMEPRIVETMSNALWIIHRQPWLKIISQALENSVAASRFRNVRLFLRDWPEKGDTSLYLQSWNCTSIINVIWPFYEGK